MADEKEKIVQKMEKVQVKEKAARKEAAAKSGEAKLTLKTPKGTQDFGPKQMVIRKSVLDLLVKIFESHGAESIDTPVFELRDVLMGKYGEEGGKLVYDLADQGGEMCSLRYDLTVPFARYVAMNKLQNLKRYHIAKVYRRDNPVMTKGRFREFYQCDFDIAGQCAPMMPEAEVLKIADQVLSTLQLGDYEIRLNHRGLLEGMFALSGIRGADFKAVCSSVDKLDKVPWAEVRTELINEKKIDEAAVDKLEGFVRARQTMAEATNEKVFEFFEQLNDEKVKAAIADLRLLLSYCQLYKCEKNVVFEPSLARGLDYYTGAIYEVVVTEFSFTDPKAANAEEAGPVGSVAAGGRYDKLVGMFAAGSGKKAQDVPCAGISFGIERLFAIMEMKKKSEAATGSRTNCTDVYVASAQKNLLTERMKLVADLWDAGINAELAYKPNPKMLDQFQYCEDHLVPLAVIVGESELKEGVVKIRDIKSREETMVPIAELVADVKRRLNQ